MSRAVAGLRVRRPRGCDRSSAAQGARRSKAELWLGVRTNGTARSSSWKGPFVADREAWGGRLGRLGSGQELRWRSGGIGEHRNPDLGGSAALGMARLAPQPPGLLEDRQRPLDLAAFLLRLKRSETSVRVTPAGRSLAADQISSAVGSPRLSPKTQTAELAL